jgi:hypothetical protein
LVWFGEIERKFAKLSKTTFSYRSSSELFYGVSSPTLMTFSLYWRLFCFRIPPNPVLAANTIKPCMDAPGRGHQLTLRRQTTLEVILRKKSGIFQKMPDFFQSLKHILDILSII